MSTFTTIEDIRDEFCELYIGNEFVIDKNGGKVLEILGASFTVNPAQSEDYAIFGEVNFGYVAKELAWYESQIANINAMAEPIPKIWKEVAAKDGSINSNYGYLIFSKENGNQYDACLNELLKNRDTRRAIMIYTRPSMQHEYNKDGMSDFICTNTVSAHIRDNKLHLTVQMRSNDAWAGYRNDLQWHIYVMNKLINDYNNNTNGLYVERGLIRWQASSLHIYEKDFWLVDGFAQTGIHHLSRDEYSKLQ